MLLLNILNTKDFADLWKKGLRRNRSTSKNNELTKVINKIDKKM